MPLPEPAAATPAPGLAPRGASMPAHGMPAPVAGALPLAGVTVLLVEDSRFASDALRLLCQRSGGRLRRAETLAQARLHLRTYCPDVVLVDLGLPDGEGDQLIRDLAGGRPAPVVLGLSADPTLRRRALAAGAAGFLEKPLAGIGAFQRAILRHFPDRFAPTAREGDAAAISGDPLALRDDLTHAAELMAEAIDARGRDYLARFVAGLAQTIGDPDLRAAATEAGLRAEALPRLQELVQRRLHQSAAF